jgi:hypothetical protein
MALECTGHNYELFSSILKSAELTSSLINLGISSELLESTMLGSPMRIEGSRPEVSLPTDLAEDIYTIYNYNVSEDIWEKITDFSVINNKLKLTRPYKGILVAFPYDVFKTTFYEDGLYVYDMFITRLDSRIYRNITISSASYHLSPFIQFNFSFSQDGPWLPSISLPFLFSEFFIQVKVTGMTKMSDIQVVPSELITLACLTCE